MAIVPPAPAVLPTNAAPLPRLLAYAGRSKRATCR